MRPNRAPSWVLVPLLAFASLAACRAAPVTVVTPDLVERNNRAVGLLGQFDFGAAADAFAAAQAAAPGWPGSRLNLAIALMNRQGPEDATRSEALLRELLGSADVARRARYVLGLLLVHEGREAEALPLLTAVANGDPPDGFAAYFIGQLRLADAPAEAIEWHRKAISSQPLLRSAYYGAFLALRRLNREAEAAAMLARFQALERHPQATVAEFKYTRMGPLSEAITVNMPADLRPAAPTGPRFASPAPLVATTGIAWRRGGRPRSITVADIDGDDVLDLFVADAVDGAGPNAVILRRGPGYEIDRVHPLGRVANVRAALWGDLRIAVDLGLDADMDTLVLKEWWTVEPNGPATVQNFNAGAGGDALDLREALSGYFDEGSSVAEEFVALTTDGTNTTVLADRDGSGGDYSFQQLAILQGQTGLTVENLLNDGNLLLV